MNEDNSEKSPSGQEPSAAHKKHEDIWIGVLFLCATAIAIWGPSWKGLIELPETVLPGVITLGLLVGVYFLKGTRPD